MPGIAEEFRALRGVIARYIAILFLVFFGLLALSPAEYRIAGTLVPGVSFESPSFAMKIFLSAKDSLIPNGVPVIALGPVSPFVAPIVIAFLVALLSTFPAALVLLASFLFPALRKEERRSLICFSIPAIILFYSGAAFAYLVIIPETFAILYSFAAPMGVAPMFALDEFVSSVFLLTLSSGGAFLLPVFMAATGRIGLIPAAFWSRHWRAAVLIAVIFSAVITPDGSGVTMVLLSGPLLGLYAAGAFFAAISERHVV